MLLLDAEFPYVLVAGTFWEDFGFPDCLSNFKLLFFNLFLLFAESSDEEEDGGGFLAKPGTPMVGFGGFSAVFFPVEILSWGLLLRLCFFVGTFWVGSTFCLLRRIVEYVAFFSVFVAAVVLTVVGID